MSAGFYIALVHHPVMDRHNKVITASVTNLDLHDIARSARTFGVKRYFVVHPSPDEQALNARILNHWHTGYGKASHPTRNDAVQLVELVANFTEVRAAIEKLESQKAFCVGTTARNNAPRGVSFAEVHQKLTEKPVCLVFGTGYGLEASFSQSLDGFLPPISGPSDYNHLSVRSAVAIYLDRLFGRAEALTK